MARKTDFSKLPRISFTRKSYSGLFNDTEADTETRLIVWEAQHLGFSWRAIPDSDIIELTYNNHTEYLRTRSPSSNHSPGTRICSNKGITRAVLFDNVLPIANGFLLKGTDSLELRNKTYSLLQKPLVVKPAHGTHGASVFIGIKNKSTYLKRIDEIFQTVERDSELVKGGVIVEEMVGGTEYRIIATRDRVVAVMYRKPASVMGDGIHTITQLIQIKNKDPMRNLSQDMYPHIQIDNDMKQVLKEQVYTTGSIPVENQTVLLRRVSNIMAGGDAYDVTDEIHPSVTKLAVDAIRAIPGLTFGGIDFMTEDITRNQSDVSHAIIEINSAPEFAMHDFPMHGKKRGVALEVLRLMFPELRREVKTQLFIV